MERGHAQQGGLPDGQAGSKHQLNKPIPLHALNDVLAQSASAPPHTFSGSLQQLSSAGIKLRIL
jgi:hypothetical protein